MPASSLTRPQVLLLHLLCCPRAVLVDHAVIQFALRYA